MESIPIFWMQVFRILFAIGTLVLFLKKEMVTTLKKSYLWKSALAGLAYFVALTGQSLGLQLTTASKAGLISGTNIILVPIIAQLFFKKKINRRIILSIGLALIGIVVFNLEGTDQLIALNWGDVLIFCATIGIAFQIILIEKFAALINPILFSLLQFVWILLFSLILAVSFEGTYSISSITSIYWIQLLILGIIGTGIPFIIQNWGQQYVDSALVTMIFSTTPIWAMLIGITFGDDPLTWQLLLGGLFIFSGIILFLLNEHKLQSELEKMAQTQETELPQ